MVRWGDQREELSRSIEEACPQLKSHSSRDPPGDRRQRGPMIFDTVWKVDLMRVERGGGGGLSE